MKSYENIDEYIAAAPDHVRERLHTIRELVKEIAPEAQEKIGYGIPTFTFHGNLVHFAGYEQHVGFYPGPFPIEELKNEVAIYKTSKGTVQFPHDKPLPIDLIRKMTELALERNLQRRKD